LQNARWKIVAAVVVVLVIAAGGYVAWRAFQPARGPADLMQAGPLGEQSLGSATAPFTVIEYASMTCPHCADFAINTFPKIKERDIDTGKVRFIFREFPFDPVAMSAFMLARCAPKDKFFAIVDLLFHTQQTWAVEQPLAPLVTTLRQAGFTEDSVKTCLANQQILDGIEWVRARAANDFGVNATPTFFINGQMQVGEMSVEQFEALLKPPPAPAK
jgi:protein-disulfide isomerase